MQEIIRAIVKQLVLFWQWLKRLFRVSEVPVQVPTTPGSDKALSKPDQMLEGRLSRLEKKLAGEFQEQLALLHSEVRKISEMLREDDQEANDLMQAALDPNAHTIEGVLTEQFGAIKELIEQCVVQRFSSLEARLARLGPDTLLASDQ